MRRRNGNGENGRRRQFTAEEKERALRLVLSGKKRREVAERIGCSEEAIRLWKKQAEDGDILSKPTEADSADSEVGAGGNQEGEQPAEPPAEGQSTAPQDPGYGLSYSAQQN